MSTSEHPALRTERRDGVAVWHLDDGKANALSADLIAALRAELAAAESDPDIGAVVIHGREGRFCGGFDLEVMRGGDTAAISGLVADGGDLVRALYGAGVPVVAACTGHALAAGALLLLGCDVRVGADIDAKVGLNEVAIGMVLPGWAVTIAVERLSRRHLQRAVADARLTPPREAPEVGFLDEVVPAEALLETAVERAAELAGSLDPNAYARTVAALRGPVLDRMAEQLASDRAAGVTP
ncbi:MAG: crotonase/enoyl-CoA hydratase family protein [Ilumatobacteraceae bacterium]